KKIFSAAALIKVSETVAKQIKYAIIYLVLLRTKTAGTPNRFLRRLYATQNTAYARPPSAARVPCRHSHRHIAAHHPGRLQNFGQRVVHGRTVYDGFGILRDRADRAGHLPALVTVRPDRHSLPHPDRRHRLHDHRLPAAAAG